MHDTTGYDQLLTTIMTNRRDAVGMIGYLRARIECDDNMDGTDHAKAFHAALNEAVRFVQEHPLPDLEAA